MFKILLNLNLNFSQRTSKNLLNDEKNVEPAFKERDYPAELPGPEYKLELVWRNIIIFLFLHIGATYGFFMPKRSWWTVVFSKLFSSFLSGRESIAI